MAGYSGPLDVSTIKAIVQQESARLKLRSYSVEGESSFTLALALSAATKKIFFEKSKSTFSNEPRLEKKVITQFAHRMRVDGMEKFNSTTVFSTIQFAATEETLQQKQYLVTLLVYLEQSYIPDFLRLMQYPYIDSDEDDECKDGCGTLANVIAGQYKRELALLGYKDLMMSHFQSYINTAPDGVGVPVESLEKYEISFEVEGIKRLVVEMVTLDMLPKWKTSDNEFPRRILVIDDDITFVKLIEPFLKSQGFVVIVALDGEEGIKKLAMKPHLIILDIGMPVMNGYQFITAIKKIDGSQNVPIIVMTAQEGVSEILKLEGIKEYIVKPFQPSDLLKSIQKSIS